MHSYCCQLDIKESKRIRLQYSGTPVVNSSFIEREHGAVLVICKG